jgi:Skp family chaperone for outer membrane proteins
MEKPDFNSFFESYLDIDYWAEELEEKEHALQSCREKRILQRKQKRQMETQGKDHKFNTLTKNGKKTRNGAG